MGLYCYMFDQETEKYTQVEDKEINEVLQEVRKVWPEWFVQERTIEYKKRIWGPVISERIYTIYQSFGGMEYREQISAYNKRDVLNFLYGLNLGLHKELYTEKI